MLYKDVSQLPGSIKKVLPPEAQEIFLEAYNRAWQQFPMFGERQGSSSRKEHATKVGWANVKKGYSLNEETGLWEKK